MWDKFVILASTGAFAFYAVRFWQRRYRGLPRRFRCLECKKPYRSIESKARLDMVFCSPTCEQIHKAKVRYALEQL